MKVALFLNPYLRIESGGSYAFERELLLAISTYAINSGHTFYVFGGENYVQLDLKTAPHIYFIPKIYQSNKKIFFRFLKNIYIRLSSLNSREKVKNILRPFLTFLIQEESKILKELASYNIDIIWFLGMHCPTMELPYILTVWDLGHRTLPYFPEVSIKGSWEHRERHCSTTIQRATYIITGTNAGKAEIELFYRVPRERIHVLPFTAPAFTEKIDLRTSKLVLGKYSIPDQYLFYPAQFWPSKNHATLLKAVHLLAENYNLSFPVVFVGSDRGNLDYIKQLVSELNLTKSVYFLGFVPQEDIPSLYHRAFALTYTTFLGPDNLPPLEAFALGCPVIASKVSGAMEQLGDAALLFDPKRPDELVMAIKSLYENSDLKLSLIQKGLDRVSKWSRKDYIRGILDILDDFSSVRNCWSNKKLYQNFETL